MSIKQKIKAAISAYFIEPTILSGPRISTASINDGRGNQFQTPNRILREIWKRYDNAAQYGNVQVQMVSKFLTGWIAGNGANIEIGKGTKDKAFLKNLLAVNHLDAELMTKIVRIAVHEGRCLNFFDKYHDDLNDIDTYKIRPMRVDKWEYTIETDPKDMETITGATFEDSAGQMQRIEPDRFSFANLDNSGNNPNLSIGPMAGILTNAVNTDKCLADWRDYDHFWGSLGMFFEAKDVQTAQMMTRVLDAKTNWAIGDTISGPAKAYFPEPTGAGVQAFEKEITMRAKISSAYSGVPIHLFGFASEMSNRATAEEMNEAIYAHTSEPRDIIQSSIKELIQKIIVYHNSQTGENIRHDEVDVKLTQVTSQQIQELMSVWVPLEQGSYITKEEVQSRVPGIDPAKMNKELEKNENASLERQLTMINNMEPSNDEPEEDNNRQNRQSN